MQIALVGLNPRTAPQALWRKVAVSPDDLAGELARLKGLSGIAECALVANARRLECYVVLEDGRDSFELLAGFIASRAGATASECMPYLYMAEGADVAGHLFNVVCALDSFAFEDQPILDQVREVARVARERRASGPVLGSLLSRAVNVAERAGVKSSVDAEAIDLSAVAFDVAGHMFDDLPRREVLLVGGGRACEMTARRLVEAGVGRLTVINSAAEHANAIARSLKGTARRAEDLEGCLAKADIVLSSTSAQGLTIDARMMRRVHRIRRGRLMLAIDFAEPGRIDPACANVDSVYLYGKRDLERISGSALSRGSSLADSALDLISNETFAFSLWLEETL